MTPPILWMHDLSPHADAARYAVLAVARLLDAEVVLAHATGPGGATRCDDPHPTLDPLVTGLVREGVASRERLEPRKPEDAARHLVAAEAAGLVIVSASRVHGLDRFLVGSTARRILRAVPVPVLVVAQHPFRALRRILVAVDVDHRDDAALRWADRLARASGARVSAVAVVPAGSGAEDMPGTEVRLRTHVERALAGPLPPAWTVQALVAETAQEGILYAARDHDLVVLTSHGRTGLARFLEGSVAEDVVKQCPVSVLVAR